MGLKKGQTNNPSGRPSGTKNKKTLEWEALGEAITSKHAERLNIELAKLEGKEFIQSYAQILEYFKPKLQRTELKSENKTTLNINPIEWVD